jgi:hypothetical protein
MGAVDITDITITMDVTYVIAVNGHRSHQGQRERHSPQGRHGQERIMNMTVAKDTRNIIVITDFPVITNPLFSVARIWARIENTAMTITHVLMHAAYLSMHSGTCIISYASCDVQIKKFML